MSDQPNNVYAPTDVHVDDVAPTGELDRAERGTRLAAAILDGLLYGAIGIVAAIAIPAMGKGAMGAGVVIAIVVACLGFLAVLAVNILFLHRNGQTVGKKIMGIKVVRMNGERVTLVRFFFLRFLPIALIGFIPIIGSFAGLVDALFIFRDSRQCLHDSIADTIVIKV